MAMKGNDYPPFGYKLATADPPEGFVADLSKVYRTSEAEPSPSDIRRATRELRAQRLQYLADHQPPPTRPYSMRETAYVKVPSYFDYLR